MNIIKTMLILASLIVCGNFIYNLFGYNEGYKDEIPKNFTLGENLHYKAESWCRTIIYEVDKFDMGNQNLLEMGFAKFKTKIKSLSELSEDSRLNSLISSNIGFMKDCIEPHSPFKDKFSSLIKSEEVIYSYHNNLHEFLFYDPIEKNLYHIWGG